MPTLTVSGRTLHYTDTGPAAEGAAAGAPVVALHSGGLSSRQWSKLAALLAPRHRVLAPDFLGAGGSSAWPESERYHHSIESDLVSALLEAVGEPVHLIGHSFGGLVALRSALQATARVRSLGLFEPVAFGLLDALSAEERRPFETDLANLRHGDAELDLEGWLRRFIDWWQGLGAWDGLPQAARTQFLAVGRKVRLEVTSLGTDRLAAADLQALAMPALILRGERSPLTARRTAGLVAQALPQGRLRELEGVGHLAPVTHANDVNALLAAHLSQSEQPSPR